MSTYNSVLGPDQIEPDGQVPNSEDAEESEANSLLSEVKPERNKHSTIHTAHQFLKDPNVQVEDSLRFKNKTVG